jgi:hypothetical protein
VPILPPEPEIVYIELPAPEPVTVIEEKDNAVLTVIIAFVILILFIALNLFMYKRCIARYKNRIQVLEA